MAVYFITRHAGAREWAARHRPDAVLKSHVDVREVAAGDVVLGTLPVHLAADTGARGARYFHLVLDLSETDRQEELTGDEMEARGAKLVEYRVERVSSRS
jgi:CRISPR-associated protein Csx16